MKGRLCAQSLVFSTVLAVLLIAPLSARADYIYTFSGSNLNGSINNSFSFDEASLITTTGVFSTSFVIDATTFTHGYFDLATGCFAFSTDTLSSCAVSNGDKFYGFFTSPTSVGTFAVEGSWGCAVGPGTVCELLSSLTISQASSPVPEPSSFLLLGSGALGVIGAIRRKLLLPL